MTTPVLPMSTEQWQNWKLGPSPLRTWKWQLIDARMDAHRFRTPVHVFAEAVTEAYTQALQPVFEMATKIMEAFTPVLHNAASAVNQAEDPCE